MDLRDTESLTFELLDVDGRPDLFNIKILDVNDQIELGNLIIEKDKSEALLGSLKEIVRIFHGPFEPRRLATTMTDGVTKKGTIDFLE